MAHFGSISGWSMQYSLEISKLILPKLNDSPPPDFIGFGVIVTNSDLFCDVRHI